MNGTSPVTNTSSNGWENWKGWDINVLEEQVTDVWLFFLVIFASGIWLIYLTFYNSRDAIINLLQTRYNIPC